MPMGQLDSHMRMNLKSCLTPYIIINSKWNIDQIIRVKTIKLLNENTGVNLYDIESHRYDTKAQAATTTKKYIGLYQSQKLLSQILKQTSLRK